MHCTVQSQRLQTLQSYNTLESYNYHCSLLEGPLVHEDSVTYGVLYASCLNEINHFHVVGQLPQDIMHILLEGVIPYEVTLMLTDFVIDRKYLSPSQLNNLNSVLFIH